MKKKIHIMVVAFIAIAACLHASPTDESFLKVTYVTEEGLKLDSFSIEGGEIQILDNVVDVVFTANTDQNKSYVFDKIHSFQFVTQIVSSVINTEIQFAVFSDETTGVLHLRSEEPLGLINIYSVAGTKVRSVHSSNTEVDISIKDFSPGVYIVKNGNHIVKFVK